MAINAKLELRQSQQLVMTPQLQQAIKLLQLSNLELSEFVAAELESNPLLERDESEERPLAPQEREVAEASRDGDPSASDEWVDNGRGTSEAANALDTKYDNIYPDTSAADLGEFDGQRLAGSDCFCYRTICTGFIFLAKGFVAFSPKQSGDFIIKK